MTDAQRLSLLRSAVKELKLTQQGYVQWKDGGHWEEALTRLAKLEKDLQPPPFPTLALGPITKGGKSVLLHDCTHITDILGWPAFDDAPTFTAVDAGHPVFAPEDCRVYDNTSGSQGGDAFYIVGASGIRYWVAHIASVPAQEKRFSKGQMMTRISGDHARPHVHLGVDARKLLGRHLVSHTNYTHGAPTIGAQLRQGVS